MPCKAEKLWKLQVYDGLTLLYEQKVRFGQITERSIADLLRALVAKHSLSEAEIVGSFAKKGTKIRNDLLEVERLRGGAYGYTCGESPYATATIENTL